MPPVQRGGTLVCSQILKVLRTAWGQIGGNKVCRAVVNVMAPGIRADKLQTSRETAVQLQRQTVVSGVAPAWKFHDVIRESIGGESIGVDGLQIGQRQRQCVQLRL